VKRYLLFAYDKNGALGGGHDYVGSYATLQDADAVLDNLIEDDSVGIGRVWYLADDGTLMAIDDHGEPVPIENIFNG
jgi:hypothetical protein